MEKEDNCGSAYENGIHFKTKAALCETLLQAYREMMNERWCDIYYNGQILFTSKTKLT